MSLRFLNAMAEPGRLSANDARILGMAALGFAFLFDLATGKELRVDMVYLLALFLLALHIQRDVEAGLLSASVPAMRFLAVFVEGVHYASRVDLMMDLVNVFGASGLVFLLCRKLRISYEQTLALSQIDALTGIPNRRAFEAALKAEVSRQGRHGGHFSLLMIDLDDFKKVNDLLGHDAGDGVLIRAAMAIKKTTRKTDVIARLGGDEFVVLMLDASGDPLIGSG